MLLDQQNFLLIQSTERKDKFQTAVLYYYFVVKCYFQQRIVFFEKKEIADTVKVTEREWGRGGEETGS